MHKGHQKCPKCTLEQSLKIVADSLQPKFKATMFKILPAMASKNVISV